MKSDSTFKWGAFFAAVLSSICCLGPAFFIALGLGVSGFTFFLTYRPLFIFITIIFLALSFYYTYKKRPVVCEDGTCKMMGGTRKAKIILWTVTFLAIAFILSPYWVPYFLNLWGGN